MAKPNNWARSVGAVSRQAASGELAPRDRVRLAYWASFADFLRSKSSTFQIRRQNRDHWFEFPIGRSGIAISATISYDRWKRIGVELYFHRDPAKIGIRQLAIQKEVIEAEFGESLDWQELPGKKASRIAIFLNNVDPSDERAFPELHAWMLDHMERFRRVFAARVKALNLDANDVAAEETLEG